jgi:putative ABC transport system permease protein
VKLGWKELVRRPGLFAVAGAALTVLTVLILFLGGLLDGLYNASTGLLRAQDAALVSFSEDARSSIIRSRVDAETAEAVAQVEGVESVGGLGVVLIGARAGDSDDIADVAVVGYEAATADIPQPPGPGQALADGSLSSSGIVVGSTVEVGPNRVPLEVVGTVEDTSYLNQAGLWVAGDTFRDVVAESRPDAVLASGTWQVLLVDVADGADPSAVATAIDEATGTTRTVTRDVAISSLPGVSEQGATFTAVIAVTLLVVGVVAALFFALITIERTGLYGVLKALGSSTPRVFGGVLVQAVAVALGAFAVGGLLMAGLSIPLRSGAELPFVLEPVRLVVTAVALVAMSIAGSLLSLRRVVKVDPASAIG